MEKNKSIFHNLSRDRPSKQARLWICDERLPLNARNKSLVERRRFRFDVKRKTPRSKTQTKLVYRPPVANCNCKLIPILLNWHHNDPNSCEDTETTTGWRLHLKASWKKMLVWTNYYKLLAKPERLTDYRRMKCIFSPKGYLDMKFMLNVQIFLFLKARLPQVV